MFYSHQLLARKAPLGQIWMAATMHAKMNRKKLNKLNLIAICEQILNPSVPMALRLSGILMGGVVIVYERKVKLLYDDVTRLLVEINEAWKVKATPDPTVLPKGKSQAKKEAVTLPEYPVEAEEDVGDIMEQSLNFSGATTTMGFQQTSYFAMRLDTIDEPYLDNDPGQEDTSHQLHQADADNIKLFDRFDSYQGKTDTVYNRFERFDIDGDEETQMNFTSGEHLDIPTSLVPSPPPQEDDHGGQRFETYKIQEQDNHVSKQYNECEEPREERQRQDGPVKRKTRRQPNAALDYHQTIIPGHVYQTWLQNSSDIISGRGRRKKARRDIMSTMKISNLMELPPTVLIDEFLRTGNGDIYYPAPLLQLWLRSSQPYHDSPSEKTSPPLPPEPSLSSPPQRVHNQDGRGYVFDDFRGAAGSESLGRPIEKLRVERNDGMPLEIFLGDLGANLNNGIRITETSMVTPGNSVDEMRSIPSSGSGHGFPSRPDANSGRSNKKRPLYSSSIHSGSGLEPVAEENFLDIPDPNLKLSRLSENELLVETGPTQTQHPIVNQPLDKLTESIRTQMKAHFEMPGAPQAESLNNLSIGMNRKGAALLFHQTCVLATRGFLRVEQKEPYGDILISKGAKM